MNKEIVADLLSWTARLLAILIMAFFSFGLYFRVHLYEPNPYIMWAEVIAPWIVIAILWVEALGILGRPRP
jgi:predicted phosphatase